MNAEKNDMVLIQLDRPRELRFSTKALKEYSALTNTTMMDLTESLYSPANQMSAAFILLKHDSIRCGERVLTQNEVEDLLDKHVKPAMLYYLLNLALDLAFKDEDVEADMKARKEAQTAPPLAAGTGVSS